ncbi:MAG: integrase core domain-containing protein [Cyanobacteria bacterium REEB65]|nr:integrase core domain-containing protein [Cyanobacteria bacterium REEB65]
MTSRAVLIVAGHTGREDDGDGLYNYRARYYDPGLGRFSQQDPLGLMSDLNLYRYALGNPLDYLDPSGDFNTVPQPTTSDPSAEVTYSGQGGGDPGLALVNLALFLPTDGESVAIEEALTGSAAKGLPIDPEELLQQGYQEITHPSAAQAESRTFDLIEQWRQDYNQVRPHSSLGNLTPEEFARKTA